MLRQSELSFQPTITETSRCLAAELSPIAQRQAEDQARRFARLEALRQEVVKARQVDETFTPQTNRRVRCGGSGRRSGRRPVLSSEASSSPTTPPRHVPTSRAATVFASTPTSHPTTASQSLWAAADDLDDEEVRGLWEAFAEPCDGPHDGTTALTADGACRLLAALGLLSFPMADGGSSGGGDSRHDESTRVAVRDKFLRALGLDARDTDAHPCASFDRFAFVFTRVWRAASCTPSRSNSRTRSGSAEQKSSSPRRVTVAAAAKKRVSFQLPNEIASSSSSPSQEKKAPTPAAVVVAVETEAEEEEAEEALIACELSDDDNEEEEMQSNVPSPEPRDPQSHSKSVDDQAEDESNAHRATSSPSPSPALATSQGLSESPDDAGPLDADEMTPHVAGPRVSGARLVMPTRTPTRPAISSHAHVLTPTVSTAQKQQAKRAAYDPMAECTFAPVTTPYTPPPRRAPSVEAATSPIASSPTPPPVREKTVSAAPPPTTPAGFEKAVQRLQQARAPAAARHTAVSTPKPSQPRPSMFARRAGEASKQPPATMATTDVVVDLYADDGDQEEEEEIRLYVDVELPAGGVVRVPVYGDDTPVALAAEFAAQYKLTPTHRERLELMLSSLPMA